MSNLLKMSLALESDTLKKRVHAAVIQVAQQQAPRPDDRGAFGRLILGDMRREWPDFILDVAANQDIQAALAVSDNNQYVVATNVTDEQITASVNGTYLRVANKYAPQPETGAESGEQ